ncbi:YadA-like family protein [Pseudomonas sp. R2.Fl]|nr:YadA-like family protein [Pseudomonas sp. R2.Fl]
MRKRLRAKLWRPIALGLASAVAAVGLSIILSDPASAQWNCTGQTINGGLVQSCSNTANQGIAITANPDTAGVGENLILRGGGNNGQAVRNYFNGNADNANQSNIWIGDSAYTDSTTTIYANHFIVGNASTTAAGAGAAAIGNGASASGVSSIAFGTSAIVSGAQAVAIGQGATAANANSVALGAGSVTSAPTGTGWRTGSAVPGSTVSVGSAGATRRITNLADGSAQTDAATVGQLQTITTDLGGALTTGLGGGAAYNPSTGVFTAPQYSIGGTIYTNVGSALSAQNTIVTTFGTTTATALGGGSTYNSATGAISTPVYTVDNGTGTGTTTVSGVGGAVTNLDQRIVAVQTGATGLVRQLNAGGTAVDPSAPITVGASTGGTAVNFTGTGGTRVLTGVTAGAISATSTDSVNGSQLFTTNQTVTSNAANVSTYLGGGANVATGTAPTYTIQSGTYNDVGSALGAVDTNLTTLNDGITNGTTGVVQRTANPDETVLVASGGTAAAPGAAQRLTNLADGAVSATSTEAINGSQLFDTNQDVAALDTRTTTNETDITALETDALLWDTTLGAYDASHGSGSPQQITNVAPGDLSATSTDAVNGSQLFDTNEDVAALDTRTTTNETDITALQTDALQWDTTLGAYDASHGSGSPQQITNVAPGDLSATSTDAVNGSQLFDTNQDVAALDTRTTANETAIDDHEGRITTNETDIAALETDALLWDTTLGAYDASHGSGSPQQITNVAPGDLSATSTDAVNGSQLFDTNEDVAAHAANVSSYLGGGADVAAGTAPNYTVQGGTYNDVGSALGAVDTNLTTLNDSVVGGTTGVVQRTANPDETVLVASGGTAAAPGAAQRLTNLADGAISATSTEAVNGSQLFDTNQDVAALDTRTTANETAIDDHTDQLTDHEGRITTNETDIAALETDALLWDTTLGAYDASHGSGSPQQITNVAPGDLSATSTDAVNGSQLFDTNQTVTSHASNVSSYLGGGANVAAGTAPTYTIQSGTYNDVGSALGAVDTNLTTLNDGITNGTTGVVQRTANPDETVLVASGGTAAAPGAAQRLTNLADGAISATSTEAVNGSQLFDTNQDVAALDTRTTTNETAIDDHDDQLTDHDDRIVAIQTGEAGLVQQLNAGGTAVDPSAPITVGAGTGGTSVDFTGTDGIRRLVGVSEGIDNTDAVNLGQMNQQLTNVYSQLQEDLATGVVDLAYFQADAGPDPLNPHPMAMAEGSFSVAVGQEARALSTATRSIALGAGTVVAHENSVALGADSETGRGAQASYTAFGISGAQSSTGEVSLGVDGSATRQITNLAAGSADTDAVNVGQLRGVSDTLGNGLASSLGGGATYDPTTGAFSGPSYTIGDGAGGTTTVDNVGDALTNIDGRVGTLETDINNGNIGLVRQDAGSRTIMVAAQTDGDAVDFSGTAGDRRLTGVAAGEISATSTEAVNGSQLYNANRSIASALGGDAEVAPDGSITAPTYEVAGNTYNDVGSAFGAVDDQFTDFQNQIDNIESTGSEYVGVNSDGPAARASGEESAAFGGGAIASGRNSSAYGSGAVASGTNSTAMGSGATAGHDNATAIGAGATTSRDDQVAIGTTSNTYTMPGITSSESRAAQSGPLQLVTSDANGNLATVDMGDFFNDVESLHSEVEKASEGVAIALALGGVQLPGDRDFAISMNYGNFDGHSALGFGAIGHVRENLYINGGVGVGFSTGTVAGRVGATWAW